MRRRFTREALMSAIVSALATLALVLFFRGSATLPVLADWWFPCALLFLTGWGLVFNGSLILQGHEEDAIRVAYPNDGHEPERLVTAKGTAFLFGLFWASSVLQMLAIAH
jgi:hypothetical protein